jgi:hypothetical protein
VSGPLTIGFADTRRAVTMTALDTLAPSTATSCVDKLTAVTDTAVVASAVSPANDPTAANAATNSHRAALCAPRGTACFIVVAP